MAIDWFTGRDCISVRSVVHSIVLGEVTVMAIGPFSKYDLLEPPRRRSGLYEHIRWAMGWNGHSTLNLTIQEYISTSRFEQIQFTTIHFTVKIPSFEPVSNQKFSGSGKAYTPEWYHVSIKRN